MADIEKARPFIPFWKNPDLSKKQVQLLQRYSHLDSIPTSEILNFHVAKAVAKGLPKDTRYRLAADGGIWADALAWDSADDVRARCAKEAKSPESLARLVADRSFLVIRTLAERDDLTPEHMAILAGREEEDVRVAAAGSPSLTRELGEALLDDPSSKVRHALILGVKHLPVAWCEKAACRSLEENRALVERPCEKYPSTDVYESVMAKILDNSQKTGETLAPLARWCSSSRVLSFIAKSDPKLTPYLLFNASLPGDVVERMVTMASTPEDVLILLKSGRINDHQETRLLEQAGHFFEQKNDDCDSLTIVVLKSWLLTPQLALAAVFDIELPNEH